VSSVPGIHRFIGLEEARQLLAEMSVVLNERQMKRAADKDAEGRRRLPFFIDPIDGTLKIERQYLIDAYVKQQIEARRQCKPQP
jgi:hypothetical protein